MSPQAITTVVADFGGVLTTPLWEAFAEVQEQFGIPPEALGEAMVAVARSQGANPLFELECGRMTEARFHDLLEERLAHQLGRPVGMHSFPERYFAALRPNDELIAHLASVRDRGYRLALLTNNVREWEPRWRAMLPVDELFELVVDSAFVGLRKPDPRIYELTAERLGVSGDQIVFLDDFAHNCDAAREEGWSAIWFQDTAQTIAELEDVLAERGVPPRVGGPQVG